MNLTSFLCLAFGFFFLIISFSSTHSQNDWPPGPQIPQGVHLSATGDPTEIVIVYVTHDDCDRNDTGDPDCSPQGTPTTTCEYGLSDRNLNMVARGYNFTFHDGGSEHRNMSVHIIKLTELKPDTRYYYRLGDADFGWNSINHFQTLPVQAPIRFAVYGDLGDWGGQNSIPRLQSEVGKDVYDAVIHLGDFAYNLETDNARTGDRFLNDIEPIAASIPYLVAPGNHECAYNFSNYKSLFWMPGEESGTYTNLYSSLDIGPVHLISLDTEMYFYQDPSHYNISNVGQQWNWLIADLERATKNRDAVPWIVAFGHRPLYSSFDFVQNDANTLVYGIPVWYDNFTNYMYGLESVFSQYKVDLYLCGHVHAYERSYPVSGGLIAPTISHSYVNPKSTVYIISGAAGAVEGLDPFPKKKDWSAFGGSVYGYGRLNIMNSTHLHWQQIVAKSGALFDEVWIQKD